MRRQKRESEAAPINLTDAAGRIVGCIDTRSNRSNGRRVSRLSFIAEICMLSFLLSPVIARAGDVRGKVVLANGPSNANAVIYIETVDSAFSPPDTDAVMNQKHLAYLPEVLPVLAGTTVKFLNSDDVLHDVFTPSQCAGGFNLGSFPPGESKTHVFRKAGCFALILCDIHPEMQAWIVVLQNPYFAVSDREGNYVIRGIPAGTYTLRAWFGYYKSESARIVVPQNGNVNMDFQLKQ